jgi:hypothetical protein
MSYISNKQISIIDQVPSASAQIAFDSSKWVDNSAYIKSYKEYNKSTISPNGLNLNTNCTFDKTYGNILVCKIPK